MSDNKLKFIGVFGGGLGDEVWDREIILHSNTFEEAYEELKTFVGDTIDGEIISLGLED